MNTAKHGTRNLRKFIKWAGLAIVVPLTIMWVGSGWYFAKWDMRHWGISVVQASIGITTFTQDEWEPRFEVTEQRSVFDPLGFFPWFAYVDSHRHRPFRIYEIPFWSVVLPLLIPTAVAWRRDYVARRNAKEGRCPYCAYSLSNLASDAVCPECGKAPS